MFLYKVERYNNYGRVCSGHFERRFIDDGTYYGRFDNVFVEYVSKNRQKYKKKRKRRALRRFAGKLYKRIRKGRSIVFCHYPDVFDGSINKELFGNKRSFINSYIKSLQTKNFCIDYECSQSSHFKLNIRDLNQR